MTSSLSSAPGFAPGFASSSAPGSAPGPAPGSGLPPVDAGLCDADQCLLAGEPDLPGLAWLLDPDRFAALARQLAPEAGITGAETTYLRYKPGVSAVAVFRLERRALTPFLVSARALDRGHHAEVSARLARLARLDHVDHLDHLADRDQPQPGQPAPCALDEPRLVLLRPEDDRHLRAVRDLLLAGRRPALLTALLGADHARRIDGVDLLRYKPGRRLVACLLSAGVPVALIRVIHRDHYARALAGAALGAATGGPALLGASARHQALVTRWTAGTVLSLAEAGPAGAGTAGSRLAELHAHRIALAVPRNRHDDRLAIDKATAMLSHLLPGIAPRVRQLARRAVAALEATPWEPTVIHGDFAADQVIMDGAQCRFIDWDRARGGDPAADLGSFAARIEMQVIDGTMSRSCADRSLEQLQAGYAERRQRRGAGGGALPDTGAQTAAGLLRLAGESFRRRLPSWWRCEEALLDRVQVLLERIESRSTRSASLPPARQHPSTPVLLPGAEALLERALDPASVGPALADLLGLAPADLTLAPPRLLRHKPGRRALLAYDVRLHRSRLTLLGKIRFKGLDRNGSDVQQALASRLGDGAVIVPEVLGCVPALNLWIQYRVPGERAGGRFGPGGDTTLAAQVGEALAALHDRPVTTRRRWAADDELDVLHQRLGLAATERPDLALRIEAVLAACRRLAASLPAATSTGIHRDFHPDQVLVDGDRLVLIDFDLYAVGDPALDAGNFAAHLIELALRLHGRGDALDHHRRTLVERYLQQAPAVAVASVEAWTTLGLARHIQLSLQFPDRRHATGLLVQACEQRLDLS